MTIISRQRPSAARDAAVVRAYRAGVPIVRIGNSGTVTRILKRRGVAPDRKQGRK